MTAAGGTRPETASASLRRSRLLERAMKVERKYEVQALSHLALVCSDMAETVRFYSKVLHVPLVMTEDLPGAGQRFFFEYAPGQCIAYFWFESAPPRIVNVTAPNFGYARADGRQIVGIAGVSAHGTMHHVCFDVPVEEIERIKADLSAQGIRTRRPRTASAAASTCRIPTGRCWGSTS